MSDYTKFMNDNRKSVTISLSPTTTDYQLARAEFEALTGSDDTYSNQPLWQKIIGAYWKKWEHKNMSLKEAQTIAEPIRIAHPDQCVNITTDDKCFIGNTSWNDQLKMFFEYETYTPEGTAIMEARKVEAAKLGIQASWE